MMSLRWARLIAWKDLQVEFRSGGRLLAMIAFVVLACFLFALALDRSLVPARNVAASLAWLTILFAATTGAGRTFDTEEEDGAIRHLLLTPVSRHAIFLGKSAANLVLVWIVTILAFVALTSFLGVRDGGSIVRHGAVLLPGTIGLAAVGTFFGLMSRHSSLGDTLLPVLTFPLLVPVIFFGATASGRVLTERPWEEISGSVRLLWAFAIGFVAVGSVLFRYLAEE